MDEMVCQVTNRENQAEFVWSAGGGFFRPYAVAGAQLTELREAARVVRKELGAMVCALNMAGDGPAAWEPSYAMAEAGFRLYNCLLPSEDETARKVRKWLEEMRKQTRLDALEIVLEEEAADPGCYLCVPWNLVYDERPAKYKSAFQAANSVERWRPFWSIRYNLTSGRRVEPMKRLPVWREPRVVVVVDPGVYGHLEPDERAALDEFLSEEGLTMAGSMDELEAALEEGYPRLLYWLGHASPEYLQLGDDRIAPSDLRNLLRSFDDRDRPEGMLAFLNCCQTAETGQGGSFLDVLHSFGFTGAIATEQQTIDTFANRLGLAFLRGFLREGRRLGELLHEIRLGMAPLGLLYGAHCPPEIRVKRTQADSGVFRPTIAEVGRMTGVALRAEGRRALAEIAAAPPELPERPYPSLGYYDRADRALFTGRDTDVVRFAARLDRRDTRILILHGESGLGKSSFLRAGVIPYLEENCAGYRFLRRPDGSVAIIQVTKDPIGQFAQGLLDVTERPLTYRTPDDETITIDLRPTIDEFVGGPADFESLRTAMRGDVGLFAKMLAALSGRLPHVLVVAIDQAEELFTLARTDEEVAMRDHTLAMIQRVIDIRGDVKLILSLRTEYIGRLVDHLRAGRQDLQGVRDDLLRDFTKEALETAIERPTSSRPIGEGLPSPRQKYGFRFAEGVAARIAKGVLDLRTEHQDSVLPLIQVICTQLYERKRSGPGSVRVISHEDLDEIRGVEGGLRAFVEGAMERTLRLDPPDREAFKTLFTRLYSRQVDGTLTTWLASRDVLERSWNGSVPFAQVVEAAVSVRLLREDALRVEGTEPRPYIRLGHDALAKVAAAWQAERDEEERLRNERTQVEQERKRRQEQVRKLVAGMCVAAGLAVLFAVMGIWALSQRRAAVRSASEATANLRAAGIGVDEMVKAASVDLAEVPQMAPVQRQLLEQARRTLEDLWKKAAGKYDPDLSWVSARFRGRLGNVQATLGDYRDAEVCYRDAIARLEPMAVAYPAGAPSAGDAAREELGWGVLFDLVWTRKELGVLLKDLYRLDDARRELLLAAADARKLEGSREPTHRELIAAVEYEWGVLLAKEAKLRGIRSRESEVRESEDAYKKAIARQEDLLKPSAAEGAGGASPTRDLVRQRTALGRFRNNLGVLFDSQDRVKEAEQEFRGVLETIPASEPSPGPRWYLARASQNLGSLMVSHPEGASAEERKARAVQGRCSIEKARDLLLDLHREFPEVPQYAEELADVYANLGDIERAARRPEQAMDDARKAEVLSDRLVETFSTVPKYHVQSAKISQLMARIFLSRNDADQVEKYARQSTRRLTGMQTLYPEMQHYLRASLGRADWLSAQASLLRGQKEAAREAIERAVADHRATLKSSPESPRYRRYLWDDYLTRSFILQKLGDRAGAARDAEELPGLQPDNPDSYTQAAYALLRLAEEAPPDRKAQLEDRAMERLRQAVTRARFDPKFLQPDNFKPLSHREDFQRLLRSREPGPAR